MPRRSKPIIIAFLLCVVTALGPAIAAAQDSKPAGDNAAQKTLERSADWEEGDMTVSGEVSAVEWDDSWDKFRWWEYPASVGLLGFGLSSRFLLPPPDADWTNPPELDQQIIDAVAVREKGPRDTLTLVSDITFYGAMAYRAVDSTVVPGLVHDNPEVAWQMAWMDLQAFSVVAGVLWGSQLLVGRVRPTADNCDDPTRAGYRCGDSKNNRNRSFIAGHPATSITAAGLTCLHHEKMPLYGGGWGDTTACGAMIGNAVVGTTVRLMVEAHYPSDVLMGVALGVTAGYVVPKTLHYGWGDEDETDEEAAATARLPDPEADATEPVFTLSPSVTNGGPAAVFMGKF